MYVRRFLNEPGHHGGAFLLLSVPDTEGARGSYVESSVRFEIADRARKVQFLRRCRTWLTRSTV